MQVEQSSKEWKGRGVVDLVAPKSNKGRSRSQIVVEVSNLEALSNSQEKGLIGSVLLAISSVVFLEVLTIYVLILLLLVQLVLCSVNRQLL
jgi:hypothetical protein